MKHLYFGFFSLLFIGLLYNSCNVINPKEPVPTYIQIDSVQLNSTDYNVHGSVKHKITDVWVYYNYQLLGAFELPAKVPIIANGTGQIQVVAGIWDNGMSGTRAKYPFYTVDTFTFNASPTQTIHHIPKFTCRTGDFITYKLENFEQGNTFVKYAGDSNIIRSSDPANKFEEDWVGLIDLHDSINDIQAITSTEYALTPNKDAYVEFHYKSDINFSIYTYIYHAGDQYVMEVMSLKARENWTKIYLNVTGFAAAYQYGKFKFIIKAALPANKSQAKVLLDNFKIVYYN